MSNSKALASNFTAYTLSGKTLTDIAVDIPAIVRGLVTEQTNDNNVTTWQTSKGKNSLFMTIVGFVKSVCQVDPKSRLPEDIAQAIKDSIRDAVNGKLQGLLDEYQGHHIAITTNQLGLKIKEGEVTPYKKAQVKMERHNLDLADQRWAARCQLTKMSKQLATLEAKPVLSAEERLRKEQLTADIVTAEAFRAKVAEQQKSEPN